jgi:two-component system phosphate regulon sensor histidine kinase PhoR
MTTPLIISLCLLHIVSGAFYFHARRAAARSRELSRQLDADRQRLRALDRRADAEKFSLQTILASMAEGVIISDAGGVIQADNRAFREMFAVRDNPVGRRAWEVLRQPEIMPLITGAIREKRQISGELVYEDLLNTGGRKKFFRVSVSALGGGGGAVALFHDISRVAQLEELRKEFVANVSHELRTPLSIFRGYLETLLDHPDMAAAERQRIYQVMKRHSDRLNSLVEDLLTLSRLESGQIQLNKAPLTVGKFFAQLREDWTPKFIQKKCSLTFTNPDAALTVTADKFKLEQVFYNLLDNALKYSDADGGVSVGVTVSGGKNAVEFYVRDTGIGIPSDKVEQIFQRFFRVDKARSREQGGTGLGLSIVKHIVQIHGGSVRAESALGKGTTVWFSLPV